MMPLHSRTPNALQDVPWVEEQLTFLSDTVPDLVNKLSRMKAGLLLALVRDTQVCILLFQTASRMQSLPDRMEQQ